AFRRAGARPSGKNAAARVVVDRLGAEQAAEPGARRQRLRRRDEHAGLQAIVDDARTAIAAADRVDVLDTLLARAEHGARPLRPRRRHVVASHLVAPEAVAARTDEIRAGFELDRRARHRETVPARREAREAHGRMLEL